MPATEDYFLAFPLREDLSPRITARPALGEPFPEFPTEDVLVRFWLATTISSTANQYFLLCRELPNDRHIAFRNRSISASSMKQACRTETPMLTHESGQFVQLSRVAVPTRPATPPSPLRSSHTVTNETPPTPHPRARGTLIPFQ